MSDTIYKLTTPYSDKMDTECPWNVYPRPQLKRDSFICLNGRWDFAVTKSDKRPAEFNEKILVPFPPESELSGINKRIEPASYIHYRRSFVLPEGFVKNKVILRFGAVDRLAILHINGVEVGSHSGGYLPFAADITDFLLEGENEIYLKVKDGTDTAHPYGKQKNRRGGMWYTPVSGIWQTVWLESLPENYIENILIYPLEKEVRIDVFTEAEGIKITLTDSGESFESTNHSIIIRPKEINNWTPDNPYLYSFTVETENDKVESYFALRKIGIDLYGERTRITLNSTPYLFNGLLDQGYYPDGLYLPATPEGYEEDILAAKRLGFNTLRKHVKIEPSIFYYLCDKLGMAVFQDMVNNCDYSFIRDTALPTIGFKRRNDRNMHASTESRAAFEETMEGSFRFLHNHPSVLYYTIFNEGWGQYCADEMYLKAKRLDRTRIVDTTSGWFKRSLSDVDSTHVYFKSLPQRTDSVYPLVISEFGGYSYRVENHLFSDKNYGYKRFETNEEYEDALVSLYEGQVLPLVKYEASAFIYTQLSDVEDETNGLLTYDRRVIKVNEQRIKETNDKLYSAADELTRTQREKKSLSKKTNFAAKKSDSGKEEQGNGEVSE